jgi:hypothetical protein
MSQYEITVEIKIKACVGSVDTNPVEHADGSFRLVMADATASSIDDCEQALLRTNCAAVRQAISAHLSALSKKKPRSAPTRKAE